VKEIIKQQLSTRTAGKWLLIVDNADNMDVMFGSGSLKGVKNYLPKSEDGLTIFTSRNQKVAQSLVGSDVLEVEKMEEQEAVDFLEKSLVRKDMICDNAIKLLTELDYLPLAIAQAAAFINTNKVSISEYLRLLKDTDENLVYVMSEEFRDSTRYDKSVNAVAMTWVVSFNQILKDNTDAVDLLAFMSCIEWKAIPRSILPVVSPPARMAKAISTICSYSFAVQRDNEAVYDIHRLVHLAVGFWLRQKHLWIKTSEKAIQHLVKVFPLLGFQES